MPTYATVVYDPGFLEPVEAYRYAHLEDVDRGCQLWGKYAPEGRPSFSVGMFLGGTPWLTEEDEEELAQLESKPRSEEDVRPWVLVSYAPGYRLDVCDFGRPGFLDRAAALAPTVKGESWLCVWGGTPWCAGI